MCCIARATTPLLNVGRIPKNVLELLMNKPPAMQRPSLCSAIRTRRLTSFIEPALTSLACCVLGLDDVKPFLVDIPLSKTVDHLKKAVKKEKENAFHHIDADQLEIWKVGDPAQRTRCY